MKEWENDTCVKFAMWGEQGNLSAARQARNYVIFRADQPGYEKMHDDQASLPFIRFKAALQSSETSAPEVGAKVLIWEKSVLRYD